MCSNKYISLAPALRAVGTPGAGDTSVGCHFAGSGSAETLQNRARAGDFV